MFNYTENNIYKVPNYIIQGLLIVACFTSAALGRWMNYTSFVAGLGFLVMFLTQNKRIIDINVNIGWCLFLAVYPVFGNLLCNGTDLESYLLFNYIVVILYFTLVKQDINIINFIFILLNLFCFFEGIFVILQRYVYAVWVKFGWRIVGYGSNRISGVMTDYSLSGYVLAIGVILAFFTIKNKYLKITAILINFFGLLVTSKRSHLLILLIGIVLLYIVNAKNKIKAVFNSILLAVIMVIVLYVLYRIGDSENGIVRLVSTVIGYFNGEDMTELSSNRNLIYEETIALWQTSDITILFGNGWGFFSRNTVEFQGIATSHNVFLQLLCETGLIGCGFFAVLLIIGLYHSVRNVLNVEDEAIRKFAIVTCYIQFHFIGYCFLGSPLYDTVCFFCYVIAVAFSEYLYYYSINNVRIMEI